MVAEGKEEENEPSLKQLKRGSEKDGRGEEASAPDARRTATELGAAVRRLQLTKAQGARGGRQCTTAMLVNGEKRGGQRMAVAL